MLSTKVIQLMTFATSGVTYSEHFHANTNMWNTVIWMSLSYSDDEINVIAALHILECKSLPWWITFYIYNVVAHNICQIILINCFLHPYAWSLINKTSHMHYFHNHHVFILFWWRNKCYCSIAYFGV
jgi:hypothetical protein